MSLEPIVNSLNKLKRKDLALDVLNTFKGVASEWEQYDDLAKSYFKIREYKSAIECGEKAYTVAYSNERMWVSRSNLINLYNYGNYPEKAMPLIRANEIVNNDKENRLQKSFAYFLMNMRDEAEKILIDEVNNKSLTDEERNKIMFNLGAYKFWRDDLQGGLNLFYNYGKYLNSWKSWKSVCPDKSKEKWDGSVVKDRNIVMFAEAGIGDEIINFRFMHHIRNLGMNPTWFTARSDLASIFRNQGFNVIMNIADAPHDYVWISTMEAPLTLKLECKDLYYGPYIKSSAEFDTKHTNTVLNSNAIKIGIRWQGNVEYDHDLHRSISLADIVDALPINAELYSLQKDSGLEELDNISRTITRLDNEMETFEDTLAIINKLDVVVTSCTSVAHAAAAMGKKTFVFVPINAYYIWSHSTEKSPWYGGNVTILRQENPRDWSAAIIKLKTCIV